MVAAAETAARNPLRPPETLPRDARSAITAFAAHPSPRLIALLIAAPLVARLALGHFRWADLAVALGVIAYFPFNEWLIHVHLLHFKPRVVFGRRFDFKLPMTHRRHHADPWNPKWVFIPRGVHAWTAPLALAIVLALWSWKELALTGLATYLLLGLHYEWVHFLAHIPWCPQLAYYQRRVREHRYHHFRNENYWWGVSMGLGDRMLGTAPPADDVQRSGTTRTL